MPFDCIPVIDPPRQVSPAAADTLDIRGFSPAVPLRSRASPTWFVSPQQRGTNTAVAVLTRARDLISEEQRWCKRAFAVTWLDIPVTTGSRYARRFCALGAIKRAARELRLPADGAQAALERQTGDSVPDWNDDKTRTHSEVVAAFDAAIAFSLSTSFSPRHYVATTGRNVTNAT
jgi:hypothetical protein